jgi:hypothetical protein
MCRGQAGVCWPSGKDNEGQTSFEPVLGSLGINEVGSAREKGQGGVNCQYFKYMTSTLQVVYKGMQGLHLTYHAGTRGTGTGF